MVGDAAAPQAPASRPPGRPQRLPVDVTPIASAGVDTQRRLAWLLATLRLLSPATAHLSRSDFLSRLRLQGVAVDRSRLSRIENGTLPSTTALVTAYGSLIGKPEWLLPAVRSLLDRPDGVDEPPDTGRTEAQHLDTRSVDTQPVDDVFDVLLLGDATGGDWMQLVHDVSRFDRVYVHGTTWSELCTRLVTELTRSSGAAALYRSEAAAVLMRHPQARGHLIRSIGRFVMDRDTQNVAPALALLAQAGDVETSDLVLRLMKHDRPLLRRGALVATAALASRDALGPSAMRSVEQHVAVEFGKGEPLVHRTDHVELATQLPGAAFDRVMRATRSRSMRRQATMVRGSHEFLDAVAARSTADRIATRVETRLVRGAHDPDQMLRRLIREGLFHASQERRHQASMLLGASPYAPAVAAETLELTQDDDPVTAGLAWSMLRRLGHVVSRSDLAEAALGEGRSSLYPRALVTLGMAHGPIPDHAARRIMSDIGDTTSAGLRHAAVFALGMAGHPSLGWLRTSPQLGPAADWWTATGSSLHDAA